jgi:hypothetical protein
MNEEKVDMRREERVEEEGGKGKGRWENYRKGWGIVKGKKERE